MGDLEPVTWCSVDGPLHPATHLRARLCELHFDERRRARRAWQAREQYHQEHPTSPDPGTWEDAEKDIDYSRVDSVYTSLNPEDRAFMRTLADRLEGISGFLRPFAHGNGFYEADIEDFKTIISTVQVSLADVVTVLRLHGLDPLPARPETTEHRQTPTRKRPLKPPSKPPSGMES